jgi:hypothetical protein
MRFPVIAALTFAAILMTFALPANVDAGIINEAKEGFSDGNWRAEISVGTGIHSGRQSRSGDMLYMGNVEYEFPIYARTTLGLKAYPLFVYDQDDGDADTVVGGGIGIGARYYFGEGDRSGWFGEATVAALGHSNEFEGNSSNFNFMTGVGLGYEFQNDWHVTAQFHHFSNAGFGDSNSGTNTLGLGIGYSF